MLVEFGCTASSLPEFTQWRIEIGNRWRLPFEYVTRVLDLDVKITVRSFTGPRTPSQNLTNLDYFPTKEDHFHSTAEVQDMVVVKAVV